MIHYHVAGGNAGLASRELNLEALFNQKGQSIHLGGKGNGTLKYTRVALILVLLMVAIPVSAEPWIAFSSKREGNRYCRFIVHPDGSNLINLSESLGVRPTESQSPDKTKIVFDSRRGGNSDIFVMDIDGSNRVKLSHNTSSNYSPRWSPDGTQVLWYGWPPIKGEGGPRIYLNNPDGTNLRDLGPGLGPHWSPDGTKIGFTLYGTVDTAFIVNADGSGRRAVTERIDNTRFLSWSPDGSKIALAKRIILSGHKDITSECVYVMNLDGSDIVHLSKGLRDTDAYGAAWSPDGRKVAFYTSDLAAPFHHIFVVNADGTNRVNLSKHQPGRGDRYPRWSPNGREILFETDRDGNWEVYIMNADGSNPFNLSNHPAEDCCGYWYNGLLPSATSVSPQDKLVTTWGQIKALTSGTSIALPIQSLDGQ